MVPEPLFNISLSAGRRNLSDFQFKLLIGQEYELEKKLEGGDKKSGEYKKSLGQNDQVISGETRNRIANEHNISPKTVQRSADLYKTVEAITSTTLLKLSER